MGCCKTPKFTLSASLLGVVGADWQKSGLNLKILPKSVVLPPWTPIKRSFNFFAHQCKGKVFINIFYVKTFVSNVFRV